MTRRQRGRAVPPKVEPMLTITTREEVARMAGLTTEEIDKAHQNLTKQGYIRQTTLPDGRLLTEILPQSGQK